MDKFSELIAKGIAKFEHTPIAPEVPVVCPVCRMYNNTFGAATDTHMSPMEDGTKVITGHMIADKQKFDRFLWSPVYGGCNFSHAGYFSFSDFMSKHHLRGRYDIMNGDTVYILSEDSTEISQPNADGAVVVNASASYTTDESIIPQNVRFLTTSNMASDVTECLTGAPSEIAKKLNESRYVMGTNWTPVYMSDGVHMTCRIKNKNILL